MFNQQVLGTHFAPGFRLGPGGTISKQTWYLARSSHQPGWHCGHPSDEMLSLKILTGGGSIGPGQPPTTHQHIPALISPPQAAQVGCKITGSIHPYIYKELDWCFLEGQGEEEELVPRSALEQRGQTRERSSNSFPLGLLLTSLPPAQTT